MDNIILCMNAVLPLFLIIALGYTARRLGMIQQEDVLKMNKLAFYFFMPFILFGNIYNADLEAAIRPQLILFAVVCIVAAFLLAALITPLFIKNKAKHGVIIQGIFRSNHVIVGLPIAAALLPGQDLSSVAVLIVIVVAEYNVLSVICLSIFSGKKTGVLETVLKIIKNPLMVASAIGLLLIAFDLRLPVAVERAVNDLSKVGGPLALFLLGAFLDFSSFEEMRKELFFACFCRLILMPAIFLTLAYFMGFRGIEFAALLGAFAASSAVNSFILAQQMGGDAKLAGAIVVMTSTLCPFTIFIWSILAKTIGAI